MNSQAPQNFKILVVDDDAITRSLLILSLKKEGYQVEEATNGAECLQKYQRLQPDLVLLDALMPEMDGFQCCQQLRELSPSQFLPILMITFLDDNDSLDKAFNAGATDYITKPIHWRSLRQRVKTLLQYGHGAKLQAQEQSWRTLIRQGLSLLTSRAQPQDFTVLWEQILSQLHLQSVGVVNGEGAFEFSFEQSAEKYLSDKTTAETRVFRTLLESYLDQNLDYLGEVSKKTLGETFKDDKTLKQNCVVYVKTIHPLSENSPIFVALGDAGEKFDDPETKAMLNELSNLVFLYMTI